MKKSKKIIIALAVAAVAVGGIAMLASTGFFYQKFEKPVYDKSKEKSFSEELAEAKKGEVVFLGDSITDFYDLKKYHPEFTAYNRGISGDSTHHVLDRMESVYALEPSVVVLLIGVNDFMNESRSLEATAADYEKIIVALKEKLPNAKIVLQSVYPGFDGARFKLAKWQDTIKKLNVIISEFSVKYDCIFADIYPCLLDNETGMMDKRYTNDGCHPNEAGYEVISKNLKPYIEQAYQIAKDK